MLNLAWLGVAVTGSDRTQQSRQSEAKLRNKGQAKQAMRRHVELRGAAYGKARYRPSLAVPSRRCTAELDNARL
jgi:hypothetical protein